MRKTFPGHFPPEQSEIDRLWVDCLFTVDANILLNLYRYSDATRNEFIKVLKAIKDRLWLPHRAGQEYFDNRLRVIYQQESAYENTVKTIQSLNTSLSNARQHPFLSDKLMQKLNEVISEVITELESNKAIHANRILSDEIRDAIGELFDANVGQPFSGTQLDTICKEGEDRYARKIPPGYKDDRKEDEVSSGPTANTRKYGDLIVWQQIIDHAAKAKKGIIFVNDDKKEDWWLIFNGKTLGPRPEIISEFLEKTGQAFYMYQADRFLEFAAKYLKQKITPASMDEIRDMRRRDRDEEVEILLRAHEARHRRTVALRHTEMIRRYPGPNFLRLEAKRALTQIENARTRATNHQEKIVQMRQLQDLLKEKLDRSQGQDNETAAKLLELTEQIDLETKRLARSQQAIVTFEKEYKKAQEMLAIFESISEEQFEPTDE